LEPPGAVTDDVYDYSPDELNERNIETVAGTLGEALEALEADDVIRAALGDHAYQAFFRAKSAEWDEYRIQVTEWERERYLESL